MHLTPSSALAQRFERDLGDPRAPDAAITFRESLALDEREAFPERAVAALDAWGLARFYVPEAHGGALASFEALSSLVRVVARRDLTAAVAHAKTFLGAAPVWVAGTASQRDALGADITHGLRVSLGLTEEAHGGDLLATETVAVEAPGGYALSGEKWLINNATRGDAVTVLARTDPRGGPRGFSLLFVDKRRAAGVTPLPRIATHGIRGADISGLRFERCAVPAEALVGARGQGLEVTMKALQLTRTLVPSLSLGALDTALREVLAFARSRRIGGGAVSDIPHARRALAAAFVELVAAEALVRAGARSVHVAPERLAVWSAAVKYLVPTRVDAALGRLSVVLGARHYLRASVFEKILRDHRLVALFDGSTVVNLSSLAHEVRRMAPDRAPRDAGALRARVETLFDLRRELPAFRPEGLDVMARGDDELAAALATASNEVERLSPAEVEPAVGRYLASRVADPRAELAAITAARASTERPLAQSPESFAAAERYARVHGAVACLMTWLHSRTLFDGYFARGEWLALALWQLSDARGAAPEGDWYERALERLADLDAGDRWLSLEGPSTRPEAAR